MAAINGTESPETLNGTAEGDTINGFGGNDTLNGGGGDDELDGGAGIDTLNGEAGDDRLVTSEGTDTANGGIGADTLVLDWSGSNAGASNTGSGAAPSANAADGGFNGRFLRNDLGEMHYTSIERFEISTGGGADNITTASGDDIVNTGGGNDFVNFGSGADQGDGGAGEDGFSADLSTATAALTIDLDAASNLGFDNFEYLGTLSTGSGDDRIVTLALDRDETIHAGAGSDTITSRNGNDVINGGTGLDTLILDWSGSSAGAGNTGTGAAPAANGAQGGFDGRFTRNDLGDMFYTSIERFIITTGGGSDNVSTAAGDDEIRTGAGTDTINSGAGADYLDGGAGNDAMTGGAGDDIYVVDSAGDTVTELADGGTDEIRTSLNYSIAGLVQIENLAGTSSAGQSLTGNIGNNVVTAGAGNDLLNLWVGGGDDNVRAGAGDDNIFFGATLTAADVVNGEAGVDTLVVQGPYGSLNLTANITGIENVSILGGDNTNFGEPGTNRYDYVLTVHDANFAAGVQARINGAALLAGEDFTFDGSAETDAKFVVYGGKGKDTLTGGLGNDIFFFAEDRFATGDTVDGGAGYDGMFLRGNYVIDFNAPGYTGLFSNIENLTLTSATDERYARGGGTDFDYNLTLSDALVGAGQTLTINGTLLMATETMLVDASQETNGVLRLFGGAAGDTLKGGGQADLLHGNLGADILTGNGGADLFRYQDVAESGPSAADWIMDFTPGTDRIELDRIDANTLTAGNQAFRWIGSNAFSGTGAASAGELRAYESSGTWFVEGDVNGDGTADLVIALVLQGPVPLGATDFIL